MLTLDGRKSMAVRRLCKGENVLSRHNHFGNDSLQTSQSEHLDYIDTDSYLQDACLKELVTADLFIRLDKHTKRRETRARKVDKVAAQYILAPKIHLDCQTLSKTTVEPNSGQSDCTSKSNASTTAMGDVWLVAPELSDSLEPALNIAKQFLSSDYAVHLVTRLKPNDVEHALNKYELVINNTDSRNENEIHYHFVKPLESYCSHIRKTGLILSFYLPLSASLSIHEIKHILVVDASQNESMLLLGRAENNLKRKAKNCLPQSAIVDLASIPDKVATWNSDAGSQLEPVLSRKIFDLEAIYLQNTQDSETPGNLPPPRIPTLSACLIAKDEEGMIEDCLLSLVPVADEVILNDTGSKDNTAELAENYGAKVIRTHWENDFSKSRNESIDIAQGNYILIIDADERLTEDSKLILRKELLRNGDAYLVTITNRSDNPFAVSLDIVRLFKNFPSYRFAGEIHEQIAQSIKGPTFKSKIEMEHYGYSEIVSYAKDKRTRNILLLADKFAKDKKIYDLFQIGVELKSTGNLDESSRILSEVYVNSDKRLPFVATAAIEAFESYRGLGRLDTAIEFAEQVLRDIPDLLFLACLLADVLICSEKYEEAIDVIRFSRNSPSSGKPVRHLSGENTYVYHWLKARAKQGLGDMEGALGDIEVALSYQGSWAPAQVFLATHWADQTVKTLLPLSPGTVRPAVKQLLANEKPSDAETLAIEFKDAGALGEVYLWRHDFEKAAKAFAESEDPYDQDRSLALIASGLAKPCSRYSAITPNRQCGGYYVFRSIPAPSGRLPQVVNLLSFLLDIRDMPRFYKGIAALSNAKDPELLVGRLLYEKGYLDLALEPLIQSCSNKKSPDALAMLGNITYLGNHFEEALVFYDELSEFRHLTVSECMSYINALLKNENPLKALAVLEESLRVYPQMAGSNEIASIQAKLSSLASNHVES